MLFAFRLRRLIRGALPLLLLALVAAAADAGPIRDRIQARREARGQVCRPPAIPAAQAAAPDTPRPVTYAAVGCPGGVCPAR